MAQPSNPPPSTIESGAIVAAAAPRPELGSSDQDTVLLAITGMSPAILTETIWALAHSQESIIPDRIIVVTTATGRRQLNRLFEPVAEWNGLSPWTALRQALAAAGFSVDGRLRFGLTGDDIRIIAAADSETGISRELPDIRSPEDNAATADFLLDQVRSLASNPDQRVVASLAGGRKTMGALLYACFTLAGRETDRLTHVLVSEPYESLPGFWFPHQPGGNLQPTWHRTDSSSSQSYNPAQAVVELADVPFVPLRNLFQRELGRSVGAFGRLMEICRTGARQRSGENLRLTLQTNRCELELNTHTLEVAARDYVPLLFLARHSKQSRPPFLAYKEVLNVLNEFSREHRKSIANLPNSDARLIDALSRPWNDDQELRRSLSDIRRRLRVWNNDGACLAELLPERGRISLDLQGPQIFLR